jgi:hypothetical protein
METTPSRAFLIGVHLPALTAGILCCTCMPAAGGISKFRSMHLMRTKCSTIGRR